MGESFFAIALISILTAGGGNDLLDLIPSPAYWQAQQMEMTTDNMLAICRLPGADAQPGDPAALVRQLGAAADKDRQAAYRQLAALGPAATAELRKGAKSDDPEISVSSAKLLDELAARAVGAAARRLMAIRALGELNDPAAVETLKTLLHSKAMFEAEYAARALAKIEGKAAPPTTRPDELPAKALADDLWLLPANCGAVAQVSLAGLGSISADDLFKEIGQALPAGLAGPVPIRDRLAQEIIPIANQTGNMRVGAVTVGVSDDAGDKTGYAVVIARGRYDPALARAALIGAGCEVKLVDGTEVITNHSDNPAFACLLPAPDRFVFMFGPGPDTLPVKELVAAIKTGKGKLAGNEAMVKLIKAADPACAAWAVASVNDHYAQAPLLGAFKSASLQIKVKDDAVDFTMAGEGGNPDKVTAAVAQFKTGLDQAKAQVAQMAAALPAAKAMGDLLNLVKIDSDADNGGGSAKVTCKFPGGLKKLVAIPLMMFMGAPAMMMENVPPNQAPVVGPEDIEQ